MNPLFSHIISGNNGTKDTVYYTQKFNDFFFLVWMKLSCQLMPKHWMWKNQFTLVHTCFIISFKGRYCNYLLYICKPQNMRFPIEEIYINQNIIYNWCINVKIPNQCIYKHNHSAFSKRTYAKQFWETHTHTNPKVSTCP